MIKKISAVSTAVLLAASLTVASFGSAMAGPHRHHGHGAAIVGGVALGILGAAAIAESQRNRHCYRGPSECYWVEGGCYINDYGREVCRRGHRECQRPLICD